MKNDRLIDIRTISENGPEISFIASSAEREAWAKRFDIPCLESLTVQGSFIRDDLISFIGEMHIRADRICGMTLKPFAEETNVPIHLLFTEDDLDKDYPLDVDVFQIEKGKIDLSQVFSEMLGLSLNPFPKSTSGYLDYKDSDDSIPESPFAVLKKLKKEE